MRPFFTQLITSIPAHGGGSGLDTPYNFTAPNAGYSLAQATYAAADGAPTAGADDGDHFNGASGDGGDLTDHAGAFLVIWGGLNNTNHDISSPTPGTVNLREGRGSFTGATATNDFVDGISPAQLTNRTLTHVMETPGGGAGGSMFGSWANSRPAGGRDAEWGSWISQSGGANASSMSSSYFLILPAENATGSLGIPGAHIGRRNRSWFASNIGSALISLDDQGGGDEDQTVTQNLNIVVAGTYLIGFRVRLDSGTSSATHIRWTPKVDGVDVYNVRTNALTSGAVNGGRGFQYYLDGNDTTMFQQCYVLRYLTVGTHSFSVVGNRASATDAAQEIDSIAVFLINTAVFGKFTSATFNTAVLIDTTCTTPPDLTDTEAIPGASVTITADGSTKIVIGFSIPIETGNNPAPCQFHIFRNGVANTGGQIHTGMAHNSPSNGLPNTAGGTMQDSDNHHQVASWLHVETPAAGTYTYTIRASRNSASAQTWTACCNDQGASGANGFMFAFEMKFATSGV